MHVIGLICEYNPFHNGHIYHIEKIKEKYPDSILVLILNGYFLQRGEISILTKEEKTKIALDNGINLVLELPFIYGTQSADIFAEASIKILNRFKVDTIIFGSESNDINILTNIAKQQLNDNFNTLLRSNLKNGINYPNAISNSLGIDFIYNPNDLLAISYIKAILKNSFNIRVESIKRTNSYHDTLSNDTIISAKNIREKIKHNEDISNYLPSNSISKLIRIDYNEYFRLLKSKILTDYNLNQYVDVSEGIEYRLKKYIVKSNSLEEYISYLKTKRYTFNRINRMLIHILIGLKKSDNTNISDYTKVLGFDSLGQSYLKKIKLSFVKDNLIRDYELKASLLYDLINNTNTYQYELKNIPYKKTPKS